MAARLTRRAFLAAAAALPATRLRATPALGQPPVEADVIVIAGQPDGPGGEPAAWSAAHRLAQTAGLRVVLLHDRPRWRPEPPPRATAPPGGTAPPFVRGHQLCFDHWRDAGNPGWSYADVLPSFKRLERYEGGASADRGGDGPIAVSHCWDPHAAHRAFLMACVPAGYAQDSRHDFNGPRSQSVAGYFQKALDDGAPVDLAAALLRPDRLRGAVTVMANAAVQRILFEGQRAVGVEFIVGAGRNPIRLRATRGVVLGTEPLRAAQLLMVSGIGPAEALRGLGVSVVADRPGVGRNLHDQMRVPVAWAGLPPLVALPPSSVDAGLFTVSLVASPPDLQIDFVPLVDPRGVAPPLVAIELTLVQPASRGTLQLASTDPGTAPSVALGALVTEGDVTALVQGIRLARLIGGSPQLDRFRADEWPDTSAARSTAELQALVRRVAQPRGFHAGTCMMGPAADPMAVVDATLAVHGVAGLHVVGAAVMPAIVNAPPLAAALMIGDRGGDFALAAPTA